MSSELELEIKYKAMKKEKAELVQSRTKARSKAYNKKKENMVKAMKQYSAIIDPIIKEWHDTQQEINNNFDSGMEKLRNKYGT